jgi:hypothetical protein
LSSKPINIKTMKIFKFLSVFAIAAVFSSCSQEGPAGPTGPAGPQGPSGNSNVSITGFTISSGNWGYSSTSQYPYYYNSSFSVPSSDVAVVYYSLDQSNYAPLPVSSLFSPGDYLTFFYTSSGLTLWYNYSSSPAYTFYVNIVDIPQGIMVKYPGVNWNDASQVMKSVPEVQASINNAKNK